MKKIFTFFALFCSAFTAFALNPADFTIQRISAPYFVIDGNSPATGPLTAYVGFKVTNTSASVTYGNLKFTINSVSTSVAGQNYTLTSPASGITLAGTLAPGQSKVCYYYVSYPAHTTAQATFDYTLSDATASPKTGTFVIANRSSISANAGGLATQSINSQDLIGGIVYDDVTYTLGNIKAGDEADFQVSVSTLFDPTKLVLQKTQVTASTAPGVTAGTDDQLYFTTTANQSSGTVTIRFTFKISAFNFTALVLPYAGATSGATNYKYAISTDLGSGTPIVITAAANPLIITKTSDQSTYGVTNTAVFTVTIQNPGAFSITVDKITDQLPAGFTYQGLHASSGVTSANSTSVPSAGATGTITFEGGVASGVNVSYTIPAAGSIILKYTATAPSSSASNLLTTARGYVGVTEFGFALNTVNVSSTLPVTLLSFKGTLTNEKVKLDWKTVSENNSRDFEIERNSNNTGFAKIGSLLATGSSTGASYTFIDSFPQPGANLYRLKMSDNDGKSKYSDIVSILFNSKNIAVGSVYPNPFGNEIQLNLVSAKEQPVTVKLRNVNGATVLQQNFRCNKGTTSIVLNQLKRNPAGIYFLEIISGNDIITQKLLKQ